jgi:hypothetical protein
VFITHNFYVALNHNILFNKNEMAMIHSIKRGVLISCVASLAFAGEYAFSSTVDKTYHLTILHTNDHHGRFWHNRSGEYGMAARATLIQSIRDEVAGTGAIHYFYLAVISTRGCQSLTCKMQSLILRA